ncbi:MAG: holo-ACP synthase [Candidatus Diapherotrites archaeon]|uniref:Holo-ACP synthase n=1 Tax=Candidatus Iainarchaeum sp. TaxID=3101447 RepID=A0A8T4L9E4_9ARCH|nr:holo-ACP synthase [Candidatus Diapherotrites archaeon]
MKKPKGIGIDFEQVRRFKQRPFSKNKRFYQRVFTAAEIRYCNAQSVPGQHFAARFCAKEAVRKCVQAQIPWNQIEVVLRNGSPSIRIHKTGLKKRTIFCSLSHDVQYAMAMVLIL